MPDCGAQRDNCPLGVSLKFDETCRVKPFAGNTVLCHLPQQGAGFTIFDSFLDVYRALPSYNFVHKISILPPSSYHMTVFDGVNEQTRGTAAWPQGISEGTSLTKCHELFVERLKDFKSTCPRPIRMSLDETLPLLTPWGPKWEPITLPLKPVDDAQGEALYRLRDELAACLGLRDPNHAAYIFHVTIAYICKKFDAHEREECDRARRQWANSIAKKNAVISFNAPEFCSFDDMFSFRRLLTLS